METRKEESLPTFNEGKVAQFHSKKTTKNQISQTVKYWVQSSQFNAKRLKLLGAFFLKSVCTYGIKKEIH